MTIPYGYYAEFRRSRSNDGGFWVGTVAGSIETRPSFSLVTMPNLVVPDQTVLTYKGDPKQIWERCGPTPWNEGGWPLLTRCPPPDLACCC